MFGAANSSPPLSGAAVVQKCSTSLLLFLSLLPCLRVFFFFAFLLDQRHFSLSIKNGKLGCDDTIRPHSACGIKLDRANSKAVEKASLYDARGLLPRPFRDGCYVKEVICTETKKPGLRETGGSVAGSSRDGVLQRCDGGIWRFSWS